MAFFDDFKVVKKKSGVVVRFHGDTLVKINTKTLGLLIRQYATKTFLQELLLKYEVTKAPDDVAKRAKQLEKLYTIMKRRYYNRGSIKHISTTAKDFTYFVQAIGIIDSHKTTYKNYLNAQIDGLKFINDGQGIYPKPSQMSGSNAEDRFLSSQKTKKEDDSVATVARIRLTYDDKNTPLMENPRFTAIFNKINDGDKVELKEALFVADCMLQRNGRVTPLIQECIKEISGDKI